MAFRNQNSRAEYQRQWRRENKDKDLQHAKTYREKHPDRVRDAKMRCRYGIGLKEYNELLERQGGGCAICGTKDPGGQSKGFFHIDHDHVTGKVRGLLCNDHNLMLGHAKDLPEILERGAAYLRTHKQD